MKYFACRLSRSVCCVDRLAAPGLRGSRVPASGEGVIITSTDQEISLIFRTDQKLFYGGLNGPGMNKKYDGNTLWSTFYCLEDMIHGALCTNISIDIIMPPLKCKFFTQAKKEKQIFTFYIKTLSSKYDFVSALSLCLYFHLCLSWPRSVGGGTWPGLGWGETNIAL